MFSEFFTSLEVADSVRVTLVMSFWSTLISSLAGIPLGLFFAGRRFPLRRFILRLNRTLMGAPPVAVGLLAYMLLRRNGPLGSFRLLLTIPGMVFAQVLILTPIISGLVASYARSIYSQVRQFALLMGCSRRQTALLFLREMRHEILFAVLTGYSRSISEVGAVFLVGGNIRGQTRTMTTAISTLKSAGQFRDGIILGLMLMAIAFVIQWASDLVQKNREET